MKVEVSSRGLKQRLLENAAPLVDQYIAAALGTGELESTNPGAREEVWDVLKQLMLQSSNKIDIDIKSAQDVLDAVTAGKCTFDEADKLMKLYEGAKKIEGGNLAGLEVGQSGFTINILNAHEASKPNVEPKLIEMEKTDG